MLTFLLSCAPGALARGLVGFERVTLFTWALTDAALGVDPVLKSRGLDLRHGDRDGLLAAAAEEFSRREEPPEVPA